MELRRADGKPLDAAYREKYRIAEELGLMEVLVRDGWGGLTAAQSGRIGGILGKRLQDKENGIGGVRDTGGGI